MTVLRTLSLQQGFSKRVASKDQPAAMPQDEHRALDRQEWQQFVELVRSGRAQCVWSSYFEVKRMGPMREYWFVCSRDGNLANAPRKISATRDTEGLVGGFIVLHVQYYFDTRTRVSAGFNSAGKETFAPYDTSRVMHANARFGFEPEGGFGGTPASSPAKGIDWHRTMRLYVGKGKMEHSVLNAFDFDDPFRIISEEGWDWQASPDRYMLPCG